MKSFFPRLLAFLVLIALGATLALWLRPAKTPHPSPASPATAPTGATHTPSPATTAVSSSSPATPAPAAHTASLPADAQPVAGTARSIEDRYASAPTLDERASPPDSTGRFTKNRLVRTTEKYPHIRIEEQWQRDPATGQDTLLNRTAMVGDHLLVRAADSVTRAALETALAPTGGHIRRAIPGSSLYLIQTPALTLEAYDSLLASFRQSGLPLAYVEPDYVVYATFTPNDPAFGQLWGLHNTGQTGGTGDADIDATEAWDISRGSTAVLVAVIDTGIDHTHPDLAANMWTNTGEIAGNNIDDDGNGYIDDIRGWDFVNNDNNPTDDQGHGTHCAGTIGAVGNNGIGVAGVAHTVRLVGAKFLSASGSGTTSDAIEAVLYTTRLGVTLTSNSWGGPGYSQALKDAIDAAQTAGILFVTAAGNDSANTDIAPSYPAAYNSANILSVAATDYRDQLAWFSNYGAITTDLAAPGVSIYSTYPENRYSTLSGTSMACPHVAGAAALLKSVNPAQTWSTLKASLLANTDALPSLTGKVATGGRLNIARAIIVSAGPYVSVTSIQTLDGATGGASGNADGIPSPGETIALPIGVKNLGSATATGLTTQLTVTTGGDQIQVIGSSQNWPDLASGASAQSTPGAFTLHIPAGTATPLRLVVRFTTTDNQSHSWSTDTELVAFTRSTLSGRVTALTGGVPIAGASVTLTSASPLQTATTDASGNYNLTVLDGTHTLRATAPGYNASTPLTTTTPGDQPGQNFALGRSQLQVTPHTLSSTQYEDTTTQHTLTVTNAGDHPLSVALGHVSIGSSTPASAPARFLTPPPRPDSTLSPHTHDHDLFAAGTLTPQLLPPAPLPFSDGFENGSLAKWDIGYNPGLRETDTNNPGVGTTSLHLKNTGADSHNNGLFRLFPSGTQPRHLSFWVRTGSTTTHSAYFVLRDSYYNEDIIWFQADANGNLYVNNNLAGGDNSYPYQAHTWYRVEFRNLDWTARRFDYHVNGALVKAAIPFRGYYRAQADVLYLHNYSAQAESWFDDIRILDNSANWLAYTPDRFSLAPGQSTTVNVSLNSADLTPATYQASLELSSNDPANPVTTVPVTLAVQLSPNTPPVADPQSLTLDEDTSTTITLTGSDAENHNLNTYVTTLPTRGILYQTTDGITLGSPLATDPGLVTHPQRKLIYIPSPDANGPDSFQFVMKDKRSTSTPATISLAITPINDAPLARNDTLSALPTQSPLTVNVLANDTDADNDPLTITAYTQGIRGTVTAGYNTLLYTPAPGFNEGMDAFTYTITDGHSPATTARVTIYIGYLAAGDWPTYAANNARNGQYPAILNAKPFVETWRITPTLPPTETTIAAGRVFLAETSYSGAGQSITAIDLATGLLSWRKNLGANTRAYSGPAYHQGNLYPAIIDNSSHKIAALSADDGTILWTSAPIAATYDASLPPAVTDTTVLASTYNAALDNTDRATGTRRYQVNSGSASGLRAATIGDGAIYHVANNTLVRRNLATGTIDWTHTFSSYNWGESTVAYHAGRAYFVASQTLYAINVSPSGATTAWSLTGDFYGPPAVTDTALYIATTNYPYAIRQIDPATGAITGTIPVTTASIRPPLIVTNDTLIATSNGHTLVIDRATRSILQTIPLGGKISLSNGALIIASEPYSSSHFIACYRVASGLNTAPTATPQTLTGTEDTTLAISLTGTDPENDSLISLVTSLPGSGTLHQTTDGTTPGDPITQVPTLVTHPQGKVIFRPFPDGYGTPYTTFSFKVNDGVYTSPAAAITLNITNLNDAPTAVDDTVPLLPGRPLLAYWPTANDTDADGDPFTLTAFTQPSRGTLTQEPDGSLTYRPEPGFITGTDTFDYTITDNGSLTDTARVTIRLNATSGLDWPTFAGAPDHAGRFPLSLGASALSLRWEYPSDQPLHPAAVSGARVFITDAITPHSAEFVYARALDTVTGAQVWEHVFGQYTLNPPTVYGGSVFIQQGVHNDSKFHALDETTGTTRWTSPFTAQWETYMAPAASELGVYINGGAYGGMYGFNSATGAQKFFRTLPQYDIWTPTLHQNQVYSWVAGTFTCHDPETGDTLWSLNLGWSWHGYSMYRTIACDNGFAFLTSVQDVYSSSLGQELIAINLSTRRVAWRIRGTFSGTPAIMSGVVYALAGKSVKTYAATSGVPLGEYLTDTTDANPLTGSPTVTGDLVITSSAVKTYLFDRTTRTLAQTFPFGSTPALVDGNLYLTCSDKKIRAYTRVPAGNRAPTATPVSASLLEEAVLTLQLEGRDLDGDPLKFAIRSLPAQGTLYQTIDGSTKGTLITRAPTLVENPSGLVIYQAPLDAVGASLGSFTFTAHDPYSTSPAATARIDLVNTNDAPIAIPDTVALRPGEPLATFRPQDNDRDPDNDTLTIVALAPPAQGSLSLASGGSVTWTPPAGLTSGTVTFGYTIADPSGIQSSSTVTLQIGATLARDWPTYGGNPARTAYQPIQLGTAPLTAGWSRALTLPADPLVISDGRVFASIPNSFNTSDLLALHRVSGDESWRRSFSGGGYGTNAPSTHAGTVYIPISNGSTSSLQALNASDGSSRWSAPFTAQWERYLSPAVSDLGVFINGGYYGGLYGFEPATGTQRFFNNTLEQQDRWAPVLHDNRLFTFIRTTFREHSPTTGAILWSLNFGGTYNAGRTFACSSGHAYLINNTFYVGTDLHELIALDLNTRQPAWRVRGIFNGSPALAHQTIFVYSQNGSCIKAYDQTTGLLRATYALPGTDTGLDGQPIVTNDTLIAASATKTYLFDLKSLQLRQTLPAGGHTALAGHTLYLATPDKAIRTYSATDPYNRKPTATALRITTAEDTPVTITLSATDPENAPLAYSITRLPVHGTLHQTADGITPGTSITTVPAAVTGTIPRVIYTPPPDAHGLDLTEFGYLAHDGEIRSTEAPVTLTVTSVSDAPQAIADTIAITPGQPLAGIFLQTNDRDGDEEPLTVTTFTQPTSGTLAQASDGSFTYTPASGFTGNATASYTITDGTGATSTATATFLVDATAGQRWLTHGGDSQRTSYQPIQLGTQAFSLRWRAPTHGTYNRQATATQDTLYTTGYANGYSTLSAFNTTDGSTRWSILSPSGYDVVLQPVLHGADLIATYGTYSGGCEVRALDPATGSSRWTRPTTYSLYTVIPPAVSDNLIAGVAAQGAQFLGIDRSAGTLRFTKNFPLNGNGGTSTIVGGQIYSLTKGIFRQHDATTGDILWTADLAITNGNSMETHAIASTAGRAFVIADSYGHPTMDSELAAIDLTAQSIAWRIRGKFIGSPALAHDAVYALSSDGIVRAHDQATGRLIATYGTPLTYALPSGHLLVANDTLVATSSTTETTVYDLRTRQPRQTIGLNGWIALAGRTLYLTRDAWIYAFDTTPIVSFSPNGGTFSQPVDVTITSTQTSGSTTFTTDGAHPSASSAIGIASGRRIRVSWTGRLSAATYYLGIWSAVHSAQFTMTDADADNLPDWWETTQFGNVNASSGTTDSDRDGISDAQELGAGTDPRSAADYLMPVTSVTRPGDQIWFNLTWPGKADRFYIVETSTDLRTWTISGSQAGTGGTNTYTHASPQTTPRLIFRVRVIPKPSPLP
ncbi:hypothetical protein CMV30_11675 [Nibricoccus aquaticus]|uniref:Peptidase S8/S53 domain-containing protein n=1 Tax=Nibricoccus aquaticus TaxID=2576891 RepID=A0A290Q7D1_9BACT|nr:Ig-like domain-containing protein [Nibricoccus aquaticus]ATC64559.1 hypothetical protein CMV30_11675 [Nibricoccus aquaticus]